MLRKLMQALAITGIATLALTVQANAQSFRIIGGLSNFDCYNDSGSTTEGFEIEIEGASKEDVIHTWNYSAFGAPTIETIGTPLAPKAIVRYHSSTNSLPAGSLTHFGVSLRTFRPANTIHYRWLPKATVAIPNPPPVPLALPTHQSQVQFANGVPFVQDVIHNDQPDGGRTFWVLPYAHIVPRRVALEELLPDDPIVQGGIPEGSGPDGLTPERLDPGDSWSNDDPADEAEEASVVYTYEVYEDVVDANGNHSPGRLTVNMMDATITASGPLVPNLLTLSDSAVYGTQTVTGTVEINGPAPAGGQVIQLTSSDPHVVVPASVTIPPNEFSTTFTVSTKAISILTPVTITAIANGGRLVGDLTVKPPYLTTLYLAFSANFGGTSFGGDVYLISPAPQGGMTVTLSSSNQDIASVPATVTVLEGATTAHFIVQTGLVDKPKTVTIQATLGAVVLKQDLTVNPAPGKVSGKVTLQAYGKTGQVIDFTLRPTDGSSNIRKTVVLATDGSFELTGIPAKNYTLTMKGSHWLQKTVACNLTPGNVSGINVTLLNGDVNGDNAVDILDITRLRAAFGSKVGDANYDALADLNGDGSVNNLDLIILRNNYGKKGDP